MCPRATFARVYARTEPTVPRTVRTSHRRVAPALSKRWGTRRDSTWARRGSVLPTGPCSPPALRTRCFDEGHASVEHDLPAGAAPRRGVGGRHEPCAHAGLEVSRQPRCLRRACPVWQGAMAGHLRRDASCSYWYAQLVQVASEQAHDGSALGGLARRRLAQLGRKPQGLESRPRVGVARASSSRLRRRR